MAREQRLALIIGNGAYSNVARLANPVNDARALARVIADCGFELVQGQALVDKTKVEIEAAVAEFSKMLRRGATAFFYYSGHGVQFDGSNFLIPIEAKADRETHLEADLVSAAKILAAMEEAGSSLNILVLDACRNDPFAGHGYRTTGGLAPMQTHGSTLIAYATAPGKVAFDGQPGGNSPYVAGMLEVIPKPGLEMLDTFNEIGLNVSRRTGGAQNPWVTHSPIQDKFYFVPQAPTIVPALPASASARDGGNWWTNKRAAADVTVNESGLRAAMARVPRDGTLRVPRGQYTESLVISTPLKLIGAENAGDARLVGEAGSRCVVEIDVDGEVAFDGVTFECVAGPDGTAQDAILVRRGTVRLTNCRLLPAAECRGRGNGISAVSAEATVHLDRCQLSDFQHCLNAEGGASISTMETTLWGTWAPGRSPDGGPFDLVDGESDTCGVMLKDQSRVKLDKGTKLRNLGRAVSCLGGSIAEMHSCSVEQCANGARARGSGSKVVAKSSAFAGHSSEVPDGSPPFLHAANACEGASIALDGGCEISGWKTGIDLDSGGRASIKGARIAACETGLRVNGAGCEAEVDQTEISGARIAIASAPGSKATIRNSDLQAREIVVQCRGLMSLEDCRRISGEPNADLAIVAEQGGRATVRGCRIFGCSSGLRVWLKCIIEVEDTEVYDMAFAGAEVWGMLSANVCRLHGCDLGAAVRAGSAKFTNCEFRSNRTCGLDGNGDARIEVSGSRFHHDTGRAMEFRENVVAVVTDCQVFRNGTGVQLSGAARAELKSVVVRQNLRGIRIAGENRGSSLVNCDLGRNSEYAYRDEYAERHKAPVQEAKEQSSWLSDPEKRFAVIFTGLIGGPGAIGVLVGRPFVGIVAVGLMFCLFQLILRMHSRSRLFRRLPEYVVLLFLGAVAIPTSIGLLMSQFLLGIAAGTTTFVLLIAADFLLSAVDQYRDPREVPQPAGPVAPPPPPPRIFYDNKIVQGPRAASHDKYMPGNSFTLEDEDYFFADWSECMDCAEKFMQERLHRQQWQLHTQQPSSDGSVVTYTWFRMFAPRVALRPQSQWELIRGQNEGWHNWKILDGIYCKLIPVPYELQTDVVLTRLHGPGSDRVHVRVRASERIDPQNATGAGIGHLYFAPSSIHADVFGSNLLAYLTQQLSGPG